MCPSPYSATLSPDGSKIAVACEDGSVPVLDAATGQQLTQLPPTSAGVVETASFSPDGKSIVTADTAVAMLGACRSGAPSSRLRRCQHSNDSPNNASPASSPRPSVRNTSPVSADDPERMHRPPLRPCAVP